MLRMMGGGGCWCGDERAKRFRAKLGFFSSGRTMTIVTTKPIRTRMTVMRLAKRIDRSGGCRGALRAGKARIL